MCSEEIGQHADEAREAVVGQALFSMLLTVLVIPAVYVVLPDDQSGDV